MSKRKSKADKAIIRLKRLEHKLRKLKAKLKTLHQRSKKLSGRVAHAEKGARIAGRTAGDAGMLIAVKSREFAGTAAALQERMAELEAGLHNLEQQAGQQTSPRPPLTNTERGAPAPPDAPEADLEKPSNEISGRVSDSEGADDTLLPRVQANEDAVRHVLEKVGRQERRIENAQGEQETMQAQIQRLSRLHDQLQGDYESLDQMSTDQLTSLISRLDTLETLDRDVEAKIAELEQKIRQAPAEIPADQLDSLVSRIDSLGADEQVVRTKLAELEQKIQEGPSEIPTDQLASLISKIDALGADEQAVRTKLAELEQKISEGSADQLTSLMSKIDSLDADEPAGRAKLSEFEQKINQLPSEIPTELATEIATEIATDQLATAMSKINALGADEQAVAAKVAALEQKIDRIPTDQLASLGWKINALGADEQAVASKVAALEQKLGQIPTDQLAALASKINALGADEQAAGAKLAALEQTLGQIPTDQLASLTGKIDALEAGEQTAGAKLAALEQRVNQIPADELASLKAKVSTLGAGDQIVEAKLAEFERKLNQIPGDQSASLVSKIDSLEADEQAVETKLSEFEQKARDVEALVQSLESGLATQERAMEGLKSELEKVAGIAAQTQERTIRLEGQGQNHTVSLNELKKDVHRQAALQAEFKAVKNGVSRSSEELVRKVEELGRAKDALKSDATRQVMNLENLSSSLNLRSWVLAGLSFLAIASVAFTFLHTQGEIARNRDVFYAELTAIERLPAQQDDSAASGKSVVQELQRLNTSMAKLARLESKPWPKDPEVRLVQQDLEELAEEIASLKTRMDEAAAAARTIYEAGYPKVSPVSVPELGAPSLGGGDSKEYTIQLIGSFRKGSIGAFIRDNELARDAALFELEHQGKPWFVLLYGKFTSYTQAAVALESLPEELKRHKAWIRYLPRSL